MVFHTRTYSENEAAGPNGGNSSLGNGFEEYIDKWEMADVIIVIEGERIKAHKMILSMTSPFFKA